MNLKIRKIRSIRAKLITSLLLICLLPVGIMGITSYFNSQSILSKKLETTSRQTIFEVNRGMDNYFSAMSNLISLLSADINLIEADTYDNYFEFGKKLMANVKNTDGDILNVFIGTEKGKYYAYPETAVASNYDYKSRPWYKMAVEKKGQIIMTPPFKSASTGKNVVAIAKTIEKGSEVVGVISMNVDLGKFSEGLSSIKVGNSGYIFVSDASGVLIAHPDKTLIGTDTPAQLSLWKDVKANKEGFTTYEYKGERKFAAFYTSELTGWKIVATLNESELLKDTSTIRNLMLIILLVVALIAMALSLLLSKPIAVNINKLIAAFNSVAKGDLTVHVEINSKDEFKDLGQNFNSMVENISEIIKNVKSSSETVLETATSLASMAEETTASVGEVSRAIEEISQGATSQAQNSQDGASGMSDLSNKLDEIDDNTGDMDKLSRDTSTLSNMGLKKVSVLIEKSNKTRTATSQINDLMQEMSRSTLEISAISNTISQITEQTNLLSLNASIEAARAGEAGRGFSVVADEIRKLAEQSRSSTVEINKIIENIQGKAATVADAMKTTENVVIEQDAAVNETQTIFNDITNSISKMSDKVAEIKVHIEDVEDKKQNVMEQIENISSISQETASATEEVSASAEEINATMDEFTRYSGELQKLSENLREMLNRFQVK